MKIFKILLIFFVSIGVLNAQLPQSISDMIYKDRIEPSNLSILITNKRDGSIVASLNPYKPMVPASVAKIATAYAVLLEFGKNFKWPTQVYYSGKIKNGTLQGDIIVKGYGDPTLNANDLKSFAKKLRSYGIRAISGKLIIDRTFFKNSPKISSGFDKNYLSEYNAMPDALMFNDHLNKLEIIPSQNGVVAKRFFGDKSFKVINHLKATNKACRRPYNWPKMRFFKDGDSIGVALDGTFSTKCHPIILNRVLAKTYKSFYYSFAYYLKQSGISFSGGLRLQKVPKSAKLLFTHYSKPLIQIVSKTLKKSNNLYARHLFLILGAKRYGYPATIEKSQRAIREILGAKGVLDSDDFIYNGCGLTKKARLKATSAAKILDSAYRDFGDSWLNALSIAGVDGTLKKRFRYTIVKNRAFMKTGTLKRAKNIAGFVKSINGNLYNCVIFYNGAKIWLGRDVQNKIITWLVKQ